LKGIAKIESRRIPCVVANGFKNSYFLVMLPLHLGVWSLGVRFACDQRSGF